jgi:hypothetical protein
VGLGSPRRFALDAARAAYDDLPTREGHRTGHRRGLRTAIVVGGTRADPFKGKLGDGLLPPLSWEYPLACPGDPEPRHVFGTGDPLPRNTRGLTAAVT